MNEGPFKQNNFIGYEYRDLVIDREMESMYADGYPSFGWTLDSTLPPQTGLRKVTLKFKRDRKIRNKAKLTRLQRQFDACVHEISSLEKVALSHASATALSVGLMGIAFLSGAIWAIIKEHMILGIMCSLPALVGWLLPYFLFNSIYNKKTAQLTPLIDQKYDEIYEVCERAHSLLL